MILVQVPLSDKWTSRLSEGHEAGLRRLTADDLRPGEHGRDTGLPASACGPYREAIELGMSRGRNAMAIWQDLVGQYGFRSGYQTVTCFVRKLSGSQAPQAVGIILTTPGEEAQVDYGTGPVVRDGQSGKYRRTRLFVMTLGYSRKSVRLLVFHSSSRVWVELHEKAFHRLGRQSSSGGPRQSA